MSRSLDELGPVDWLVIEFPSESLNTEVGSVIVGLAERDIIRVLDIVVLRKDQNGDIDSLEIGDLDPEELGGLGGLVGSFSLLSSDDVSAISQAVQPGSAAACLVWENTWAVALASTVRRHGGEIAASGRISARALLASIEADTELVDLDGEVTHAPSVPERVDRASLVGPAPVARTAHGSAIAAVIAHGINRRITGRDERG